MRNAIGDPFSSVSGEAAKPLNLTRWQMKGP
jgi:hypothetical protein